MTTVEIGPRHACRNRAGTRMEAVKDSNVREVSTPELAGVVRPVEGRKPGEVLALIRGSSAHG